MSDMTTVFLQPEVVHPYTSPVLVTLALLGKEPDQQGVVAIVFEAIPLLQRRKIRKMIRSNFLVEKGKRVNVRFDKLVLPGKVATGIVVVPNKG